MTESLQLMYERCIKASMDPLALLEGKTRSGSQGKDASVRKKCACQVTNTYCRLPTRISRYLKWLSHYPWQCRPSRRFTRIRCRWHLPRRPSDSAYRPFFFVPSFPVVLRMSVAERRWSVNFSPPKLTLFCVLRPHIYW